MPNQIIKSGLAVLTTVILSGCMYFESSETTIQPSSEAVSTDDNEIALEGIPCRAYGFQNWSLQRNGGAVTISGEASMPTPAWTVSLHHKTNVNSEAIVLAMETSESPGFANSVISWIPFESTVETKNAAQTVVSVSCADEVVWTS